MEKVSGSAFRSQYCRFGPTVFDSSLISTYRLTKFRALVSAPHATVDSCTTTSHEQTSIHASSDPSFLRTASYPRGDSECPDPDSAALVPARRARNPERRLSRHNRRRSVSVARGHEFPRDESVGRSAEQAI